MADSATDPANRAQGSGSRPKLPHRRLMALFLISQRINQISNPRRLLDEILHYAISSLGAERGLLILTDESGETYRTVASESLEEEDISFSTSIVRRTLEGGEVLTSDDLQSDPRFSGATSVARLGILSFICAPLIAPGRSGALGTLYVDQRIHVKSFTEQDKIFLQVFANLAAIAIGNVSLMDQLTAENIQLRDEVGKKYDFPGVIGRGKAMQKVFQDVKRILQDDCTVLITGESGSGKEVIAKAIHYNGKRRENPFIALNCGALPENLLEAELFGSVRGAFTGAIDKQGLFQAADRGTLFLDEIQHTSKAMQIKLLRVLQEREVRRVGGTKPTKIDARLICATNEDLQKAVQEGRLRQDFYYRINVVSIDVPPLRERREDIPVLVHHFLEEYAKQRGKRFRGFDDRALKALTEYDWAQNNVRELENEIQRAVIFATDGATIRLRDLSETVRSGISLGGGGTPLFGGEDGQTWTYEELEKNYIQSVLSQVGGSQTKAARIMGIPRTTLRGKMIRLGLTD